MARRNPDDDSVSWRRCDSPVHILCRRCFALFTSLCAFGIATEIRRPRSIQNTCSVIFGVWPTVDAIEVQHFLPSRNSGRRCNSPSYRVVQLAVGTISLTKETSSHFLVLTHKHDSRLWHLTSHATTYKLKTSDANVAFDPVCTSGAIYCKVPTYARDSNVTKFLKSHCEF